MALENIFLDRLEIFMAQWGYSDTEFGRDAVGDPNFISEVRSGARSPTLRTVQRVHEFMRGGEMRHSRQARGKAAPGPDDPVAVWEERPDTTDAA